MRAILLAGLLLGACAPVSTVWRFDAIDRIGGERVQVVGAPRRVATAAGVALAFGPGKDALVVGRNPLAGAKTFTVEALFCPGNGPKEQRWLHIARVPAGVDAVASPAAVADTPRIMFEIRVDPPGRWYLDAFTKGPSHNLTLIDPAKSFPVGRWYHVAQSYDGRIYRSYVDGVLQAEGPLGFRPIGPGVTAVGMRLNARDHFQGRIAWARFTRAALAPERFDRPGGLNATSVACG